jgi:trans-aconitate methyltransferase
MGQRSSQELFATAWDEAADGYELYFVPRFAPWVTLAVEALVVEDLPPGPIVAPCCGTAPELVLARQRLPGRPLVGIDLSARMIALAEERLAGEAEVRLLIGDAAQTAGWPQAAALVSCFGLQQLPSPAEALEAWTASLAPGGVLSVMFWPPEVEHEGPFAWVREAITALAGPAPAATWEDQLRDAVISGGGALVRDEVCRWQMRHDDAATFWTAITQSGPMRALLNAYGDAFMEGVRARFMRLAPAGPLVHQPGGRHIVAVKGA